MTNNEARNEDTVEHLVGAVSPQINDRYTKCQNEVVVLAVMPCGCVQWSCSVNGTLSEHWSTADEWHRLVRNTIEHGAEFHRPNAGGQRPPASGGTSEPPCSTGAAS